MKDLQKRTVAVGREVFGDANIDSREERLLRFAEEFFELMNAAKTPFKDLAAMLCYEYHERTPGEVSQEIAGVQCTLFSLASVFGVDVEEVTLTELVRVLDKKHECRAKHAAKPAIFRAASAA